MTVLFALLSFVFWGALALLAHTYVVYPVLMRWLTRASRLPGDGFETDAELPEVAVLMAVYNEERVLEATLDSILASDYPQDRLRVFVGSDGSTDRSDEIVGRCRSGHESLHLVRFGGRNGKIRIVNQLAEEAMKGFADPRRALFVLCDANVSWAPTNLRRLARHFKRERVGLVGAAVTDLVRDHVGIGDQEEAYVGQENRVKFAEGVLWGRVMGAFGACYALRATRFRPVPQHYIVDDFFQTLSCIEQGSDAIVDLEAVCHEAVSVDIREEFRRKRRIAAGNFQNLRHFGSFLLPWNGGLATAFAFWSHKGLRWCGPFLLLAAAGACAVLACLHWIYWLPLTGIAAGAAMAWLDRAADRAGGRQVRLFRFARYFLSMNGALLLGFFDFLKGPRGSVWEPTRRETAAAGGGADRSEKHPDPALRR